jgi:phosphatidylinositol glycan class N
MITAMPNTDSARLRPTFSVSGVLGLALVFHLVFINSVFDCYFTSPVVHGMQHFRVPTAEAKRLVLIVGE